MTANRNVMVAQGALVSVLIIVWELVGAHYPTIFFLIGTPTAIARELWTLVVYDELWKHFVVTGSEALLGLSIGTIAGSGVGLALWYSEFVAKVARPFILALGAIPIFAFAPLMIVWFGIGFSMKVALAAFSTVFIAFTQAFRGATSVSREHTYVLLGMKANRNQIFFKAIVPGSLDWVFSSMRLNVGFGLLGAFIGEFIASGVGLGYVILRASNLYNVPRALAACVGILVLAFLFDLFARMIEKRSYVIVQLLSVPRILWRI